jgi:hypothetical protein
MEKNKVQMYIYICTFNFAGQRYMFTTFKNNGSTNSMVQSLWINY